jgi:ABC-type microcin C transport system duplicated ATPase subunit YejF
MMLQDPFASLNPVHTIGYSLNGGLTLHQPRLSAAEREAEAIRALEAGWPRPSPAGSSQICA